MKVRNSERSWKIPVIAIVFILVVVIFVKYSFFDIRIVIDPMIPIDWNASGFVIETVGVIIVPFLVLHLEHKWDRNKAEIAASNWETVDELKQFKKEYEMILRDLKSGVIYLDGGSALGFSEKSNKDKIIQYISINMGATKAQIINKCKIDDKEASRILQQLLDEGIIHSTGFKRSKIYKLMEYRKIIEINGETVCH